MSDYKPEHKKLIAQKFIEIHKDFKITSMAFLMEIKKDWFQKILNG